MTRRDRVAMAIRHQQPEIVPYHITFTIPILKTVREHFGVEDVDDLIGNHLACTAARPPDAWVEIEPGMWRDEFGVVLAHEHGRPVFIHSCGAVAELFDDLIEIGVDCFNPFQPEAMDVYAMKRRYGDRISFYGGLSTQRTLPFASPSEVVGRAYLHAESSGAGMGVPRAGMHALRNLAAPAHDVPKDVPLENLVALVETCRDQASS
jgi:uroporphyrinogen decarboxylase